VQVVRCLGSLARLLGWTSALVWELQEKLMASGKVKWWDNTKGFGFIAQESGQDVFVHHTAILGDGFKTLQEGEEVNFEIVASEKGPKAEHVQKARQA
jgi:cold shock protein